MRDICADDFLPSPFDIGRYFCDALTDGPGTHIAIDSHFPILIEKDRSYLITQLDCKRLQLGRSRSA